MLFAELFDPPLATAVFTPTTSPRRLMSGPPELPEEIAASVCINAFRNTSESSCSVLFNAEIIPLVTLGPPSSASAYPTATTGSPTAMESGSANTAGVNPD
jgi:hypothetical protein